MLPVARRAPTALRALSFAAPYSKSIIRSIARHRVLSQPLNHVRPISRPFSSLHARLQQAAAVQEPNVDEPENKEFTRFEELGEAGIISPKVIDNITRQMNIHTMTDVQKLTLNHCLDGTDVIAQARTGTGKTLAFLVPIVQRLLRSTGIEREGIQSRRALEDIRAVIISPTRELAEQIAVEARKVTRNTGFQVATAVGGTQKRRHLSDMQKYGCHILVGTPGRITDIISDPSNGVRLDNIETFVLDEADRLLDIGFAPAIEEIQSYMPNRETNTRQTLMFSATVPKTVVSLVRQTLRPDFKFIRTVDPGETPTHDRIPQHVVFGRGLQNQIPIIMEIAHNAKEAYERDPANNLPFKAIVYFGSTAEVSLAFAAFDKMRDPEKSRSMFAAHPLHPTRMFQMHGKLEQAQRTRESNGFRNSESAILFSSDVTARGMDFPNVSHVIQMGLPRAADDYVHRIGRTGRAGKAGEGWLILNDDERKDIAVRMRGSGINIQERNLITADLDMTKGAQVPGHIAKLLRYVEVGVKSLPYSVKEATYQALLGVLQMQNNSRDRQKQVDMMNELSKYGWGMQEPPAISKSLVDRVGFSRCMGFNFQERQSPSRFEGRGDRGDRGDRGTFDSRARQGSNRDFGGQANRGPGVFGGGAGDAFSQMGMEAENGGGRYNRGGRGGRSGGGGGGRR